MVISPFLLHSSHPSFLPAAKQGPHFPWLYKVRLPSSAYKVAFFLSPAMRTRPRVWSRAKLQPPRVFRHYKRRSRGPPWLHTGEEDDEDDTRYGVNATFIIIIINHHTQICSAPITLIGHRCITESSVSSADTERHTKKWVLTRFLESPRSVTAHKFFGNAF